MVTRLNPGWETLNAGLLKFCIERDKKIRRETLTKGGIKFFLLSLNTFYIS